MSVVSHIAAQRTNHGVPHAVSCRLLGVSESWYYKWRSRRPTATERRRAALDVKVRIVFETSARTYGSPRVCAQLRSDGERVSEKTVARSMRTQGLVARQKRRRRGLTRPDKSAPVAPDLIRRDFTASRPDEKWCGDFKQINTQEGPVYLGTVEDLYSRRMLGFALSDRYPHRRAGQSRGEHGHRHPRRNRRGSDFPHRPRLSIQRRSVHQSLRAAGDRPIHGKSRLRPWTTPPPSRSSPPSNRNGSTTAGTPPEPKHDTTSLTGSTPGTTNTDYIPPST